MSQKMQLPDEILDAVAGGVFTIEGERVTDLSITDEGISISCAGKTVTQKWPADAKAEILANPKEFSMFKDMMAGMQSSKTSYDLNDTLNKLFDD